jgi:hypothetical protein
MIKFPYGISDFKSMMIENYYYVDRTDRIWLLEDEGRQLLFLRPRRFGKSLLLSMLENYYDIKRAAQFEELFGHLAIGQNPTDRHNTYFVMTWDFSVVNAQGDILEIRQSLYNYLNECIDEAADYYKDYLNKKTELYRDDALASFKSLIKAVNQTPHKLYLFIDEYDNFANEVMMSGSRTDEERYKALLYGEGTLKTLFKSIKSAASGRGLERVFITGVSPVVLSDITSGYNIAKNISLHPPFNNLCGFEESEIYETLKQIAKECDYPLDEADKALAMMRIFYNGYCFALREKSFIYNPTLVIYFLEHFQKDCRYPEKMLDENLAMDRGKITYISRIPQGDQLIIDVLNEENPLSIQQLEERFGVHDMLYAVKDTTFMASLLYYFGVLTMGGETPLAKIVLKIPNLVVRKLYIERIQDMLLPELPERKEAQDSAETFYQTGNMQPLCDFVENKYFKVFNNRDYRWTNELTIKTAFLTLLFNDTFYIMDSEPALNRDYADLIMIVRPFRRKYQLLDHLIEFKYVSLKDAGLSGEESKKVSGDELKELAPVKVIFEKSKHKLMGYRKTLETVYGDALRLHCYTVVSVGFERLVWEEVDFLL